MPVNPVSRLVYVRCVARRVGYTGPVNIGQPTVWRSLCRAAVFLAGPLVFSGCGPSADSSSRALQEELAVEPSMAGPVASMNDADVLDLVQEQPAPEGEGTVMQWLDRQLTSTSGQPLFPRWLVQRRAANRFEVRFTYTWIDISNQIENRGFAWQVDGSLRTVAGPQALKPEEPARAISFSDQQQRRAQDPDYNLY